MLVVGKLQLEVYVESSMLYRYPEKSLIWIKSHVVLKIFKQNLAPPFLINFVKMVS